MKNLIKIFVLILFISAIAFGQENKSVSKTSQVSDSVFVMKKSPMGAFWRSAILPGWGQFYNESYWKIPIVWGVSAWFVYLWKDRNNNYNLYKDLYIESLTESSNGNNDYKNLRDFYRDDRDLYAIYLGLTYFLNLIDAYVDAHLFDFDVGMNSYTHKPELRVKLNL